MTELTLISIVALIHVLNSFASPALGALASFTFLRHDNSSTKLVRDIETRSECLLVFYTELSFNSV